MTAELVQFGSLGEALRLRGIPLENYALIERFTAAVGIDSYYEHGQTIKARRRGAGPDLEIAYGYTTGFASEDEAVTATGSAECWPHGRTWGVTHPINRLYDGQERVVAHKERHYGVCPECFIEYSASGTCACG